MYFFGFQQQSGNEASHCKNLWSNHYIELAAELVPTDVTCLFVLYLSWLGWFAQININIDPTHISEDTKFKTHPITTKEEKCLMPFKAPSLPTVHECLITVYTVRGACII